MRKSVKEAAGAYLANAKTVAVALSGGADSVALLSVLLELKDEYGFNLFAAHFNHKLRGEEAERDEWFVKELCERLGVKLVCGQGEVAAFARDNKLSTELAARQMRYGFLESLPADLVATAHTASDNLETVLFNLARGSGIGGLCGIPVKRDKYIRPLLFCTRKQIEDYCKSNNLEYVTDSTNLSDDYTRNRIRHKIVPLLKGINPSVENSVTNTSIELTFDRDYLDSIAAEEYKKLITDKGLNVKNLAALHPAVSGRVLRLFCTDKTGVTPDFRHTDDLFAVSLAIKGGCSLEGGFTAEKQKGILKIRKPGADTGFDVKIERQKNDLIKKNKKVNNLLLKNLLDCDKIVGEINVRTRREGDKIRLAGRGCTKTLKQLYNENGIPQNDRKNLPVIADSKGVIWVCGIGAAERVKVTEDSEFVYKISYETVYGGNNTK
ncbi:MAG: tRNA lysidine(34) synthetase TilS [Clostridia bacterium]|nr:tRNA lysidine(34) synthetase TilS [Clostridia bacterium]